MIALTRPMEEIPNQWPISVLNLAYALYLQGFLNTLYSSVFSIALRRERQRERRAHAIFYAPFAPFVLSSGNCFWQEPHPRPAHAQFLGLDAHRFLEPLGSVPRVPRVAYFGHERLGRHRSASVGHDVDQHLLQIIPRAPVVFFVNLHIAQDLARGTFDDPIPHRMRRRNAAAGQAWGYYDLGVAHEHGYGGAAQDEQIAWAYYLKAAELGSPEAQMTLASAYLKVERRDAEEAMVMCAYKQGHGPAAYDLGMTAKLFKNFAAALEYYQAGTRFGSKDSAVVLRQFFDIEKWSSRD